MLLKTESDGVDVKLVLKTVNRIVRWKVDTVTDGGRKL